MRRKTLLQPPLPAKTRGVPTAGEATTSERTRLTPAHWVSAAVAVLVDHGIDHVRVDVLAAQLGVTRGSFYWHFRDREDLLRRVLDAWREQATEQLTARLERPHASPQAQLRDVISLPFRGRSAARAARIELAIRAWARRDLMARSAVDEADKSRLDYHRRLFSALGFPQRESRARAFLLYGYEVAESLLYRQGSEREKRARAAFVEGLLLDHRSAVEPAKLRGQGGSQGVLSAKRPKLKSATDARGLGLRADQPAAD